MWRSFGGILPQLRPLLVWAAATGVAFGLFGLTWAELSSMSGALVSGAALTASFDQLLVWLAAVVAATAMAWLWVMTTLLVLAAIRGRATDRPTLVPRGCPRWLSRVVLAGCGVALAGGLAAPAMAGTLHVTTDHDAAGPDDRSSVTGLVLPDRAAPDRSDPEPESAPKTEPHRDRPDQPHGEPTRMVRVQDGDSLWEIAGSLLPDDAADDEVARLTLRLHALNLAVIGDDPDLIRPDQHLQVPADLVTGEPR